MDEEKLWELIKFLVDTQRTPQEVVRRAEQVLLEYEKAIEVSKDIDDIFSHGRAGKPVEHKPVLTALPKGYTGK